MHTMPLRKTHRQIISCKESNTLKAKLISVNTLPLIITELYGYQNNSMVLKIGLGFSSNDLYSQYEPCQDVAHSKFSHSTYP
jgi:hypothetical protein